jgi:hypothetical protein
MLLLMWGAGKKLRRQQDLNLRGETPSDFKSDSLTARTYRRKNFVQIIYIIKNSSIGHFCERCRNFRLF